MLNRDIIQQLQAMPDWYPVVINDCESEHEVHNIIEHVSTSQIVLEVDVPEIEELENRADDAESELATTKENYEIIQVKLDDAQSQEKYLDEELTQARKEIAELEARLATMEDS